MLRTNEIKSIMRKLRDHEEVKNESLIKEAEEVGTENDTSEADLLLARLEDIISRFEKALAIVDGEDEEAEAEEAPSEDEMPHEEDGGEEEAPAEDEEAEAEEAYQRSLEYRLAALERRFTESRRRKACRKFTR
jgi:hypothetical protein